MYVDDNLLRGLRQYIDVMSIITIIMRFFMLCLLGYVAINLPKNQQMQGESLLGGVPHQNRDSPSMAVPVGHSNVEVQHMRYGDQGQSVGRLGGGY